MSGENLKIETTAGIRRITVNRPEKLNALNVATVAELAEAVAAIDADQTVDAVVITGAGEKAFVAGADISELATLGPMEAKEFALRGQMVFRAVERLTKPVVAAVNGFALGGGCELAMACHIRVASSNAVFGQPEVKLGLIPGYGGTQRLPRLVGKGRAMELLLTGRNVAADEAERIGLVNKVCRPDELDGVVTDLLRAILANGPLAVGSCIEAVNSGLEMGLDDACLLEATLFGVGASSDQMREGTTAFLERRKPVFRKD
ncbi:MAG: enoyl-CoA hydratase-related protein [Candidatus Sulfomarinibacteraceae bacterium]